MLNVITKKQNQITSFLIKKIIYLKYVIKIANLVMIMVMIMKIIALHALIIIFLFQMLIILQIVYLNVIIITISLYIKFIVVQHILNAQKKQNF